MPATCNLQDPNTKDWPRSALHMAAVTGNMVALDALLLVYEDAQDAGGLLRLLRMGQVRGSTVAPCMGHAHSRMPAS